MCVLEGPLAGLVRSTAHVAVSTPPPSPHTYTHKHPPTRRRDALVYEGATMDQCQGHCEMGQGWVGGGGLA